MNPNHPYSFSAVGVAQLAPVGAGCAAEPSQRAWQWVHEQLPGEPSSQHLLPAVGALALYHHCVAKAFGFSSSATRAQRWRAHLAARLLPLPSYPWPLAYLDQACLLAWLAADSLEETPSLLTSLDHKVAQEGQRLLKSHDASSRQLFFQVLRYFSLRLPDPAARSLLGDMLTIWPGTLTSAPARLSLVQGAAAELLVCIRLARAGVGATTLVPYVHEGVRHLLTTKRPVDSSQQHYAIFPNEAAQIATASSFSAELSWRRGDLGQALLLYEAHALLSDPELAKFADLVGLNTLLRTTIPATEVQGTSLYRGAAGVAHLYRQLYSYSSQHAYLKGYEFWLTHTCQWLPTDHSTVASEPTTDLLRYGLVGMGLVLLSASTGQSLGWEVALLGAE